MNEIDQKQLILELLKSQALGVIATVDVNGKPESALIGVTETPELEIIFGTSNKTRKYQNTAQHPHVAFTVSDYQKRMTVQYEGIIRELSDEDEVKAAQELHIAKNPYAAKFLEDPNQRWFKVNPSWIRYTDFGSKPPVIFEIKF